MTLTLAAALIPVGVFGFFFLLFSVINIYHLARFGSFSLVPFAMTFMYLAGVALLVSGTYTALGNTDWSQPFFTLAIPTSL